MSIKNLPAMQEMKETQVPSWVGKIPWRRKDNPFKYSCLENPMDRGAWQAAVHRVTKSQKKLGTHSKNN